jgi:predicted O-methyltransferase YrrM
VKELVFNSDWFTKSIPEWEKFLAHLKGKPYLNALEVGCWEGRSTCWLLQNVLSDPSCRMICVDPFIGNPENVVEGYEQDVEKTFKANIEAIGATKKVELFKKKSADALRCFEGHQFDFIYLDGSHVTTDVLFDIVLAWPLLKHGGVMILDDYQYGCVPMDAFPRVAIDAFQKIFRKEIIELHRGWQMIWRKN